VARRRAGCRDGRPGRGAWTTKREEALQEFRIDKLHSLYYEPSGTNDGRQRSRHKVKKVNGEVEDLVAKRGT